MFLEHRNLILSSICHGCHKTRGMTEWSNNLGQSCVQHWKVFKTERSFVWSMVDVALSSTSVAHSERVYEVRGTFANVGSPLLLSSISGPPRACQSKISQRNNKHKYFFSHFISSFPACLLSLEQLKRCFSFSIKTEKYREKRSAQLVLACLVDELSLLFSKAVVT